MYITTKSPAISQLKTASAIDSSTESWIVLFCCQRVRTSASCCAALRVCRRRPVDPLLFSVAMKTSGLVVVLACASVAQAFLTAPLVSNPVSSSVTLRRSLPSCVSGNAGRQSTSQYMVAAPATEDTVAAVPHGGALVDLNLKTEAEKKVACWALRFFCCYTVQSYGAPLQTSSSATTSDHPHNVHLPSRVHVVHVPRGLALFLNTAADRGQYHEVVCFRFKAAGQRHSDHTL